MLNLHLRVLQSVSNLMLTPSLVSSIIIVRIMSSVKATHYGTSSWISLESSSITTVKRKGFKFDPWCGPISMRNLRESPPEVTTVIYCHCFFIHIFNDPNVCKWDFFFFFYKHTYNVSLGSLSYSFTRSIKTMCKSFFLSR